jgi:hypothetical protein
LAGRALAPGLPRDVSDGVVQVGETPYGTYVPNAADRPDWITDTPVTVDVHSLRSFGDLVQAEHDTNVAPNANTILTKLAGQPNYTAADYQYSHGPLPENQLGQNPTLGVDPGQQEAKRLSLQHMAYENDAMALLNNVSNGMRTIAQAAHDIANLYTSAEDLNNMDMLQVRAMFQPGPASGALEYPAGNTGTANSDSVR